MAKNRFILIGCFFLGLTSIAQEQEEPVVFRSDVSLVRVDVQVLDRDNRSVQGLTAKDFILREQGKILPIRNFASDELPLDVLFLLDVSGSMRPHVEHIASASREALNVLGPDDRIAIIVFDRTSQIRMPFQKERSQVLQGFDQVLRQERFNGGTDITRGMMDAVKYVSENALKDTRRAIVILTDDQTQGQRNEGMVLEALSNADTVLSALISPDAMGQMRQLPGMGSGWPGGGRRSRNPGGMGWPNGGIIIGGPLGGNYPGRRHPGGGNFPGNGPGVSINESHSAGTPEIAQTSGGDSIPVHDASSLETTLSRLRQRYSLYFQLPANAKAREERNIQIALADQKNSRLASADLRYKSTYTSPANGSAGTIAETVEFTPEISEASTTESKTSEQSVQEKRRTAVDENSHPRGPNPSLGGKDFPNYFPEVESAKTPQKGWRRVTDPEPSKSTQMNKN